METVKGNNLFMVETKKRQVNFELLRIVAMLMVITLHYLNKGGIAISYAEDGSVVNHVAWFIESFCIVAVNGYVLISGYFFMEKDFRLSRVIVLICQVLFYSIVVSVVLALIGVIKIAELGSYDFLTILLPIQMEQYWFATSYVFMVLFAPFVGAGIKQIKKKELEIIIISLLVIFSIGKTVLPIHFPIDNWGYDFGWFLCLVLIAGYIKTYGIPWFSSFRKSLITYVVSSFLIFIMGALVGIVTRKFGVFSYYGDMIYSYNYLLVLISAVALFYTFFYFHIKEGNWSKRIEKIAPLTFGVYLLHEHIGIRNSWTTWFGVEKVQGSFLFIPHMLVTVVLIFTIGIVVDYGRMKLFTYVIKVIKKQGKSCNF